MPTLHVDGQRLKCYIMFYIGKPSKESDHIDFVPTLFEWTPELVK